MGLITKHKRIKEVKQNVSDILSYPLSTQEDEDRYINELGNLYNELHKLYDNPTMRSHDQKCGKDYLIVESDYGLIYKCSDCGFAPRYMLEDV
jgi:hypothetical protein